MPYDTNTGEYIPLTPQQINQIVIDNINEEFSLNYNQTSILGSNFSKLFYTGVQFMIATEENFKLANQAIVQNILQTGFASTTLTPTSRPFILQELWGFKTEDDVNIFKYIRLEETTTSGRVALFLVPSDECKEKYDAGAYDEDLANLLYNISAIATDFNTRSSTPVFGDTVEVLKTLPFSDDIVRGLSFKVYNCEPSPITSVVIKIKSLGGGVNIDTIIETFVNNFNSLYGGGAYVPEKYINVTNVPDSLEVKVNTIVGDTSFLDDKSIDGVFLSLDPSVVTVEVS